VLTKEAHRLNGTWRRLPLLIVVTTGENADFIFLDLVNKAVFLVDTAGRGTYLIYTFSHIGAIWYERLCHFNSGMGRFPSSMFTY